MGNDGVNDDQDILGGLDPDRCGPLPYEIHQLKAANRALHDELQSLLKRAKQRRRYQRHGGDQALGCANCHTKVSPEWRRGPSGIRNLCNRCGLRWAKLRRDSGGAPPASSSLVSLPSVATSSKYAMSTQKSLDMGPLAGRSSLASRLSSPSIGASSPHVTSAQASIDTGRPVDFRFQDIKGKTHE